MSAALTTVVTAAVLATIVVGCSDSRDSEVEELTALPEIGILYPGAEWTTPVMIHKGTLEAPSQIGRRFVTTDAWTLVSTYYSDELRSWSGPRTAEERPGRDMQAAAWTSGKWRLVLMEVPPVPDERLTSAGFVSHVYALTIELKGDK